MNVIVSQYIERNGGDIMKQKGNWKSIAGFVIGLLIVGIIFALIN
ncbi:hypothetical protein NT04LM_0854 [Listeria monocytogenes FSL F2-208]|nr:hypothetical protein NT04LM_0854 [Listeria monocytogenes FSL F2-208]